MAISRLTIKFRWPLCWRTTSGGPFLSEWLIDWQFHRRASLPKTCARVYWTPGDRVGDIENLYFGNTKAHIFSTKIRSLLRLFPTLPLPMTNVPKIWKINHSFAIFLSFSPPLFSLFSPLLPLFFHFLPLFLSSSLFFLFLPFIKFLGRGDWQRLWRLLPKYCMNPKYINTVIRQQWTIRP